MTASNVTSVTTRSGATIGLTYDALNRLTVKDLPGGSAEDVYLSYDSLGHLTSALHGSPSGSGVTQAWNALGWMTSQTSYGRTLGYLYDAAGNRTRMTWPDATYVTYTIDALYRVTAEGVNGSGVLSFGYDALGRRSSIGRANGVTTGYTYDAVSRLDSLTANLASPGAYSSALAYMPSSQIRAKTQANDAAYAWKGSANQGIAYTANGLNQITAIQGINFSYDANGNLTHGAADYSYDVENKLRSASAPTAVTLDYDPLGRLRQTASGGAATALLYDGDDLIAEYNAAGTRTKLYVHGPGTDEPLVQYDASGRRFLHADERGSIVAMSNDSAATVATQGYSPTGQPDGWTISRFGYTGQIAIPEAMLWHYKARAYAPRLGRFLQTDPIGTAGGINLYAYTMGDPVNGSDPMGLVAGADDAVIVVTATQVVPAAAIAAGGAVVSVATGAVKAVGHFIKSIFGGGHHTVKLPKPSPPKPQVPVEDEEIVVNAPATNATSTVGAMPARTAFIESSATLSFAPQLPFQTWWNLEGQDTVNYAKGRDTRRYQPLF